MPLYCPKCKKWAYRNHKCSILSLIPITRGMRGVADKLYSLLGNELLSASCFVYPVDGSIYEHTIIIDLEFRRQISTMLLGDFPTGWVWYTQTVTDDHLPLMVLGYSETYVWSGVFTIEDRVQQIIKEFEAHLDTRDIEAVRAIMLLSEY